MGIFSSKNENEQSKDKFSGCHIDEITYANLTLSAMSEGISRSSLLRRLIARHLESINAVDATAKRAVRLFEKAYMSESSFITAMRDDMFSKSIPDEISQKVIDRFIEIRSKNNAKKKK